MVGYCLLFFDSDHAKVPNQDYHKKTSTNLVHVVTLNEESVGGGLIIHATYA